MSGEMVVRRGRGALALVLAGLVVQLVATFRWSPGMFILSAAVGVPLVVAGAGLFGWTVWRARRDEGGA